MLMIDPTRLRRQREAKALSRADLHRLSGVHAATIGALEAGRRNAYPRTVRMLAKALEVTPLDIASVERDA